MELEWTYVLSGVAVIAGFVYWQFCRQTDDGLDQVELKLNFKPVERKPAPGSLQSKAPKSGIPVLVYYYSQTGTAEDYAKRTATELEALGFAPTVSDVEELDLDTFVETSENRTVIFFASTYGEGDPPDAAVAFHEWLMSPEREENTFETVKSAVFGLGNKSYDHYNKIGKQIHSRLKELGATLIHDLGLGDDEENIENDFLVWKKAFKPAICAAHKISYEEKASAPSRGIIFKLALRYLSPEEVQQLAQPDSTERWQESKVRKTDPDVKTPLKSHIVRTRQLYSRDAGRECLHVEVGSSEGVLSYKTGDHIGIFATNSPATVASLAKRLGLDLDAVACLENNRDSSAITIGPCTIRAMLSEHFDISFYAKKQSIKVMAQFAPEGSEEKKRLEILSSDDPDKQKDYRTYVVDGHRTIGEILEEFPTVIVPPEHLLESLPKLQCRYYSISSSPLVHPDTVHVTAAIEDWITPTKRHAMGVVTGWLTNNKPEEKGIVTLPCFIRRSNFRLPESPTTPIIMVGPGTGLAPFRGFLQERSVLAETTTLGESILFFGCRHPDHDYMYKEELEGFVKSGALSELVLAFSRAQEQKVYVQNKMKEGGMPARIWNILNSGGNFYVCGDAAHMAVDVLHTLLEIFMEEGKLTQEDAKLFFERLTESGRYHADVW